MLRLLKEEVVLMVLHRHWIALLGKILASVLILIVPLILLGLFIAIDFQISKYMPWIIFCAALYYMGASLAIFAFWVNYYLDMWIVTNKRVININQHGLFNRAVEEFMLDRIENITIEIPDIVATYLGYGNLTIETAGERSFTVTRVPHIYEAKTVIMKQLGMKINSFENDKMQ